MPPDLKNILDKAFNNCQELHKCQLIFQEIKHMKDDLNLAKKFISGDKLEPFDIFLNQAYSKEFEEQNRLKAENTDLKNQYTSTFKENLNTNYTTPDNTEVSVEDLFNCNISKIPHVKTPSGSANSSRTSNNQSVSVNANSPKSAPVNSSGANYEPRNTGPRATFNIDDLKPPKNKKMQNNSQNTNATQSKQASSDDFNKNAELIKSVKGKMNRQADDFQSSSNFKPIVNSQKDIYQTIIDLLAEAGALNDSAILSEVEKIRNIMSNMTVIVKRQQGELEKIYETTDTEGLLSRKGDITKNLDYLQKKYPCLLAHGDDVVLNMDMPSDFVSGKSNWDAIKKRYIELKYLKKNLDKVDLKIFNEIRDYQQDFEKLVNKQLQDQLKPIIDIYSNRAKAMNNNSMFAIKVLTFIKKLNFKNLGFDKNFIEMTSSAADNHIKKYANNSKVTYNDDYLINFNQKYPKNIHDDSNIDKNTVSKMPSNLDSLSLSSKAMSFQKNTTNNVTGGKLKPGSASSGSPKNVSTTPSTPVDAGSNKKNKNKDAPDKKSAATVSTAKSTLTDEPHKKSTTNTSGTVKSASVLARTSDKNNKALDLSDIDWSFSKSSKTLDELIEKVNSNRFKFSDGVSDNLKNIKHLKGLAEKIMEQYYTDFDNLYTKSDQKRYIKLDMQLNNIRNKYRVLGYPDSKNIPKPDNFTGTDNDWNNFKSAYNNLDNEYNVLSSKLGSQMNEIYSMKNNLDNQTKSNLESKVISPLKQIKSGLDRELPNLALEAMKKILESIIKYVKDLIEKYSDFYRNFSKIYFIKDEPTKKMWKFTKRK